MTAGLDALWSAGGKLRWSITTVVGAVLCAIAWWEASGHARLDDQLVYANVSVVGLIVGFGAHVTWILQGRRRVGERWRSLLPVATPDGAPRGTVGARAAGELVAGADLRRYHAPGCSLAAGRGWAAASRSEHEAAGRRPCGICLVAGGSGGASRDEGIRS